MCSICGLIDFENGLKQGEAECEKMGRTMKHRGPDASDIFVSERVVLQHNRLSVIDLENGHQPMRRVIDGREYVIVYNGEIYNCAELRSELSSLGFKCTTNCDTEVVLLSYVAFGVDCPKKLNGIFAFAVFDSAENQVFFARDRFGIKPFFYSQQGNLFLFASEIKALLEHPKVSHDITAEGLWQLLFLTPVTVTGSGVFKDIFEFAPAECGIFDRNGLKKWKYWRLEAKPFTDTKAYAIEKTKELLLDATSRQLVSDVPLCTFLSGGLDSSVLTSIASKEYAKKGDRLSTYSFEYEDNKKNFKSSLFQPQGDDEFAKYLARELGTDHTVLTAPTKAVANCLFDAVKARDLPGQADIDSSLLYFCKQVKKRHTVAISGECSDEIFGGYPWFYRPEMLYRDFFPWIHDPMLRAGLFREEFARQKDGYDYISQIYKRSVSDTDTLDTDSASMKTSRIATRLSVDYFMTSLLNRKDRMSMYSGLEVRVPFADHRILEYVYNVPWEIKFDGGEEKALLRAAMKDYLPEMILYRKKSPYRKTHNPKYREMVTDLLKERIEKKGILSEILSKEKLNDLLCGDEKTWFGQLMSTAQLVAWLIQFDYWFEIYNVNLIK